MNKLLTLPRTLRMVGILIVGAVLLTSTGMIPVETQGVQDATQLVADSTDTGGTEVASSDTAALAANSSGSSSNSIVGTWVSIVPPLLAIGFALIFRQVLLALFMGIWMGAWLVGERSFLGVFGSFFESLTRYIVPQTADEGHMSILIFTLLIGGMIGIISKNGGTRGVIRQLGKLVKSKPQGQLLTSLLGFVIFFDDYANTMVVGNTMRPLTDKLKISRAKLAYLVDSTAAPVATVALISTWIGAMVGYIASASAGIDGFSEPAYTVFIKALPFNFYAFFTIFFVILIAISGRDFGPMLGERIKLYKAAKNPELDTYGLYKDEDPDEVKKQTVSHWLNAFIPILMLISGVIGGLIVTGEGSTIQDIIGSADSYAALVWGSMLSMVVAIVMTVGQRLLSFDDTLEAMFSGMHTMYDGLLVLVLAWSLSAITQDLGTADFLVTAFGTAIDPMYLPLVIFVLSAATAFATGSSWGTMGILMPLVLPLVWNLGLEYNYPVEEISVFIYAAVSAVLAGAVLGDHVSPISDTTILSSLATQCNQVEHVNTQMPYALVGGALALISYLAVVAWGLPGWIAYLVGAGAIIAVIWTFGKSPDPNDYA
ncbi:MAG: Na+/H+ antiporter NhaC family protein [Balneolaceae bacterium]|nr:Na+/H+ antiporter NhaC family protein [Balneolaceae bacterium]MDR9446539.1 Na+/H+ antiporter NhaC family protein [Balneolaceae bacterium]